MTHLTLGSTKNPNASLVSSAVSPEERDGGGLWPCPGWPALAAPQALGFFTSPSPTLFTRWSRRTSRGEDDPRLLPRAFHRPCSSVLSRCPPPSGPTPHTPELWSPAFSPSYPSPAFLSEPADTLPEDRAVPQTCRANGGLRKEDLLLLLSPLLSPSHATVPLKPPPLSTCFHLIANATAFFFLSSFTECLLCAGC